jgi:hypothetical protein
MVENDCNVLLKSRNYIILLLLRYNVYCISMIKTARIAGD